MADKKYKSRRKIGNFLVNREMQLRQASTFVGLSIVISVILGFSYIIRPAHIWRL